MVIAIWEGNGSPGLCNYIHDGQKRRHRGVTSERERKREREGERKESKQNREACNSDKDAKHDRARNCGSARVTGHPAVSKGQ